ncbi:MAG: 50S ribosomal protein L28 [Pseudobdellovibrionaceae bacterium]|jgi:large subunit ribosomal protein L28|nr:50S ribosomal protein L28 [Pseudobdellovibrionaceae bacterium]
MSRKCQVTGKKVMFGNNVSHAQNKTRRTFNPNVQDTSLFSEALGTLVRMRVTAAGLRTIDKKGGLDKFLLETPKSKLDPDLHDVKARVEKVVAAQA